jgi:DNA invertase Pin-like site-specific DNA recombinase
MEEKLKTAVAYIRVSTDRQAKTGTSLEVQAERAHAWCETYGVSMIGLFREEGESGRSTVKRGQLAAALALCQTKHADFFLVPDISRFSRSTLDGLRIRDQLEKIGSRLQDMETPPGMDDVFSEFLHTVKLANARMEVRILGRRSQSGMKARVMSGGWVSLPPCGFKLVREGNLPILVPDPEKGPRIAAALQAFADGCADLCETQRTLKACGLCHSQAWRALKQPAYGGIIRNRLSDGQDVPAAFEGLVSSQTWYKIEARMTRAPAAPGRKDMNPDFPLVGQCDCEVCGKPLLGSFSRGRHGGKYGYYRCRANHVSIRADEAHKQVSELLNASKELHGVVKLWREIVRQEAKSPMAETKRDRTKARTAETQAETRLSKLTDAFASGDVDAETYRKKSAEYRMIIAENRELHQDITLEISDIEAALEACMLAFENPSTLWAGLSPETGKQFLKAMIGRLTCNSDRALSNPDQHSVLQALKAGRNGLIRNGTP